MKIVYIDHSDSFADLIAYRFGQAGRTLHEQGKLAAPAEVKMYGSSCNLDTICSENPDLLLLGPGPNSPSEAGNYLEVLDKLHGMYPIFGICLGFQAMMHYFGKPVQILNDAVHGGSSDILHTGEYIFSGIDSPARFARYHSLGVYDVPECFERLAYFPDSDEREIIMAASHNSLPLSGVQFHPESFMSTSNDAGLKLIRNLLEFVGSEGH